MATVSRRLARSSGTTARRARTRTRRPALIRRATRTRSADWAAKWARTRTRAPALARVPGPSQAPAPPGTAPPRRIQATGLARAATRAALPPRARTGTATQAGGRTPAPALPAAASPAAARVEHPDRAQAAVRTRARLPLPGLAPAAART